MLLYYITDRNLFAGAEADRRARLLDNMAEAAGCGVDFIQLREKGLSPRELENLALDAVVRVRRAGGSRLLINSRVDVAVASGADGVHLRSGDDLSASEARNIFHKAGMTSPVIAVSCHLLEDVYSAEAHGADFAVFGPVFEKMLDIPNRRLPGLGLDQLQKCCERAAAASSRMPLLALGGINLENAKECLENGAAGVAAIRLFQPEKLEEIEKIVSALRKLALPPPQDPQRRHPYQS